ncbi:hypothetical protein JCM3775_001639 [Rhodotorula graminis]
MAAAKKRTASEIDDIFSAKPTKAAASSTAAAKPAAASTSTLPGPANAQGAAAPRKKGKQAAAAAAPPKGASEAALPSTTAAAAPPKRVPETIVDTSKAIEYYNPQPLVPKPLRDDATEAERKAAEEDERFMDSRGTRKKTEDGLPIYSLDELNIGHGGDTPECPFDCQCCF